MFRFPNPRLFHPALLVVPALAFGAMTLPSPARAQFGINLSVNIAPPELPVYEQPPLPAPGYIWTPGYWAYGDEGYFWVPGTWIEPPQVGLLWTPGYWGFAGGRYLFNAGYWGPTVGFYGGVNYGFGYGGLGYEGGYWRGGGFFYNHAVNNFGGVHVTNVFERNVTNVSVTRASFNGPGGIDRRPTPEEAAAMHAPHVQPTALQAQHVQMAQHNRALLASVNHGHPAIAATPRAAAFGAAAAHPAAARPGAYAPHPVARPATSTARPEGTMAPHAAAARPERTTPRPEAARPERTTAPRPEAAHAAPEAMHPESHAAPAAPRPAAEPHAMAPRPEARPAPRPAPHPAAAAHPAGREEEKPH
jgi:hypothetical protein